MEGQAGAADIDRFLILARPAAFFGELRERNRRRILLDPASEILDTSRGQKADLIAMTTHARSGVSRWMLGSVTEKVLRGAGVPLLVVRPQEASAPKKEARGKTQEMKA